MTIIMGLNRVDNLTGCCTVGAKERKGKEEGNERRGMQRRGMERKGKKEGNERRESTEVSLYTVVQLRKEVLVYVSKNKSKNKSRGGLV